MKLSRRTVAIGIFRLVAAASCVLICGDAFRTPGAISLDKARLKIPAEAKRLGSPLDPNSAMANAAAGQELYRKNCEVCHGYDGGAKTLTGGGMSPHALDLRARALADRKRTDGELFYVIRNGVPNTGMPAWKLPDQQIWRLVLFIRNLPKTVSVETGDSSGMQEHGSQSRHYAGSSACQTCHADIYDRWTKTRMANVVRNPREHTDAIIPDLSKSNPLVHFKAGDVDLVYGSKWKQRYFKRVGDDYYVFPAQWDVTHKQWRPYFVKDDWWAPLYPPDNFKRPTSALCDGCHSVNFDINTKTVTEWNVGCEKCHGPGSEHAQDPSRFNIVNPGRQEYVAANDTCIQCHSQGRPLENPIGGKYYDWPVGFDVTKHLSAFWKFEEHKLGETSFTHFPDGTAHKNRMQGNDYVTSLMYTRGVACSTCHDPHGTDYEASLRKPTQNLCLDCHGPNSPNGPHAPTIQAHTHHAPDSRGSQCVECHMPRIAQTIADISVRSHTFHFVTPARSEALKIPNACQLCHTEKSAAWATATLSAWLDRSPWRVHDE